MKMLMDVLLSFRNKSIITLLLIFVHSVAFAFEPKDSTICYSHHEVGFAIGYTGVRTHWSDDYENEVMQSFGLVTLGSGPLWSPGPDIKSKKYIISVNYYYYLHRKFAVGCFIGYCKLENAYADEDNHWNSEQMDVKGISVFIMPSLKYEWINNRKFSLYSKASLGIHNQCLHLIPISQKFQEFHKNELDEYKQSHNSFAYKIVPLGCETGNRNFRFFGELGLGSNTSVLIGLSYRFFTKVKN